MKYVCCSTVFVFLVVGLGSGSDDETRVIRNRPKVVEFLPSASTSASGYFPVEVAFWSHDGTDEEGNPENLHAVEYAIVEEHLDPNRAGSACVNRRKRISLATDWEKVLKNHLVPKALIDDLKKHYRTDVITELFRPSPIAGNYKLWVRVVDASENTSEWVAAEPPIPVLDLIPPSPPMAVGYLGIRRQDD